MRSLILGPLTGLLLVASAPAQMGRPLGPLLPAETTIGNPKLLGVTRTGENGTFWVTGSRLAANQQHQLYELDGTGKLLNAYDQPPETSASVWGLRDLAWDGGNLIYAGSEDRHVHAFDLRSRQWSDSQSWVAPTALRTVRALAYDPMGAGGNGSMWSTDFASDHVEFDRTGTVLRRIPNMAPLTYGGALDRRRGTIWWLEQGGSKQASAGMVGVEMDLATGTATGQTILADAALSNAIPGALAGGCDFYERADGTPVLVVLLQGNPDSVCEIVGRAQFGSSCDGSLGFHGDAPFVGNAAWTVDLTGASAGQAFLLVSGRPLTPPIPLPSTISLPGCLLHLFDIPILVGPQTLIGGATSVNVAIPNNPGLAAGALYMQWAIQNGGQLTTSTAAATVIYP